MARANHWVSRALAPNIPTRTAMFTRIFMITITGRQNLSIRWWAAPVVAINLFVRSYSLAFVDRNLGFDLGAEEKSKCNQYASGGNRWNHPDLVPLMVENIACLREAIILNDLSRRPGSKEPSQTKGDQSDEALCCSSNLYRGLLVHINLPGDKEEIIANAMQQNPQVEHPHQRLVVAVCK